MHLTAAVGSWTIVDAERLVHELQVSQIELEMQNEELRQEHQQMQVLLARATDLYESAPAGYVTLDRIGAIREINLSGARQLGVDRSQLLERSIGLFFRAADRRIFSDFLREVFASEALQRCQVTLARGGSSALVLRVEGRWFRAADECRAVLVDVTGQVQAEDARRLKSTALNAIGDAVRITTLDGTIQWVNAAFTATTGYLPEEAIGINSRDLVRSGLQDEDFYRRMFDALLAHGLWRGEITNRRKDGTLYVEEQTITAVRDTDDTLSYFIAVGRDLTAQRKLEAQLQQSQKMEIVGRLAGGIAHDFNNLLTVINGTVDLTLSHMAADDPRREDLMEIGQAGGRAATLTRQLLAFSRKQVMRPESVTLGVLVKGLHGMLQRLVGEDITLVVSAEEEEGLVLADPAQVEQVVMNLVINARDAMPKGGTLTIETRNVDRAGAHVMLAVRDTGVGMDDATLRRVFEPFFTTKEVGKGTGLGLSTVEGIVKQSGGDLTVESAPGCGTTLTIYLPRVQALAPAARLGRSVAGRETVLLVEDDMGVQRLATRMLRSAGYTVLIADNGLEAIALLQQHGGPVDVIVTDLVMPGMGGGDLARVIRVQRPEMGIVFTSGYRDESRVSLSAVDSAAVLPKPYSTAQLQQKVRQALDARGSKTTLDSTDGHSALGSPGGDIDR